MPDARPVRIPARTCFVAPGGLDDQSEENPPDLQRVGSATEEQASQAPGESEASVRSSTVGPNDVWAMDFVHDQLATGRKIRILTVIDRFSRNVPALDPRFSYCGEDVVRTLETVCTRIGYPKTIRVDQGSAFISRDLDLWAYQRGTTLDFSRQVKPTDNAYIDAFNGRFRAECLNAHWFLSLADAAENLEDWRKDYNEHRPHGAIGNKVPVDLMKSEHAASPCS